ncbi:enoyl-CoA hydratase/isomerase family protein [Bradyrhizobium sp. 190]|uniref:enoyl-CoA hydratase/isomerase family protein n=1 Tax=Bradyrhizobium sp. 190 TaxID=2782658 RepID=UPI001FFA0E67|nr:enoyl-CoA hydratase/isomerase family protein [Bradyrhizobium sp. 190]MCK1513768.1 enoyl-CoA hydratase/isomerase family protein [Bradyrhizobium sp. 190]
MDDQISDYAFAAKLVLLRRTRSATPAFYYEVTTRERHDRGVGQQLPEGPLMQTADGDNLVVAEQLGAVRVLTINRSDKMNAFTPALMHELDHMLDDAAWDSATRVVMITGAGQKAFVAGNDIDGLIEMNSVEAYRDMQRGQRVLFRLDQRNCQVPADHLLEQASAAIHDQPVLDRRSDGGGAQALQIHGIYDIKSEFAIVRGFGDAKVLKIVERACEMERTIIWRELLAQ